MISAILAAAAVAASTPAAAPKPTAPPAPVSAPADAAPRITAQTPLTVTFSAGFLEQLKVALHSKYTGDEADPAIKIITEQENEAVAKLTPPPKK